MISYNDFFIGRIYTVVRKTEKECFNFENGSREWDGFVLITEGEGIFIVQNLLSLSIRMRFQTRTQQLHDDTQNPCSEKPR